MSFSGYENNRLFTRAGDRYYYSHFSAGLGSNLDGRQVIAADLDRDGDLDLVLRNLKTRPIQVFRNQLRNDSHYLEVALHQPGHNPQGVGARVYARCGPRTQVRAITAGSGFVSQAPYSVYFGFGACATPARVRVVWPDGAEQVVESVGLDAMVRIDRRDGRATVVHRGTSTIAPPASLPQRLKTLQLESLAHGLRPLLNGDGRTLVLNIWAPWCGACKKEIPALKKWAVQNEKTHRVVFVSFQTDELETVAKSAEAFGIADAVLIGKPALFRLFLPDDEVRIPVTLVLSAEGLPEKQFFGGDLDLSRLK